MQQNCIGTFAEERSHSLREKRGLLFFLPATSALTNRLPDSNQVERSSQGKKLWHRRLDTNEHQTLPRVLQSHLEKPGMHAYDLFPVPIPVLLDMHGRLY